MKLDCNVIKDLYVLYKEDELGPKVKSAVDAHLKECGKCKSLYGDEEGFNYIIEDENMVEKTPSDLDDKIKLKIRLRRWKVMALLLAVIFLVYSYFEYVDDRKNLLYAISNSEEDVRDLYFSVDGSKNYVPGDIMDKIDDLNQKNNIIVRHLNYFENKSLDNYDTGLFIDFGLSSFLKTLNKRNSLGIWSERDEKAFKLMEGYFEEYSKILTDERLKLNGAYKPININALIKPVDTKKIADLHNFINELSYTYVRFGKFPEEIDILSKSEIKDKLVTVFHVDKNEIEFLDYTNVRIEATGRYRFDINSEEISGYGHIDSYTGEIIEFQSNYKNNFEGELMSKEDALNILNKYLDSVYGKELSFKINSLGINHNFSSNRNIKLYSYEFSPVNNNHILYGIYRVYIDGRTGSIYNLRHLGGELLEDHFINSTDKINYNPDEALSHINLSKEELSSTKYEGTIFIKSLRDWNYKLVHIYINDKNKERIYINALDGVREIYINGVSLIQR